MKMDEKQEIKPTREVPEFDELSGNDEASTLEAILTDERSLVPPTVSHLKPAVVDGSLVAVPGDFLTIERWIVLGGKKRWLDTETYEYKHTSDQGNMHLFSHPKKQWMLTRWEDWAKNGYDARIADKKQKISSSPTHNTPDQTGKKKRAGRRDPLEVARSWQEYCAKKGRELPEVYRKRLKEAGEL